MSMPPPSRCSLERHLGDHTAYHPFLDNSNFEESQWTSVALARIIKSRRKLKPSVVKVRLPVPASQARRKIARFLRNALYDTHTMFRAITAQDGYILHRIAKLIDELESGSSAICSEQSASSTSSRKVHPMESAQSHNDLNGLYDAGRPVLASSGSTEESFHSFPEDHSAVEIDEATIRENKQELQARLNRIASALSKRREEQPLEENLRGSDAESPMDTIIARLGGLELSGLGEESPHEAMAKGGTKTADEDSTA